MKSSVIQRHTKLVDNVIARRGDSPAVRMILAPAREAAIILLDRGTYDNALIAVEAAIDAQTKEMVDRLLPNILTSATENAHIYALREKDK